MTSTVNVLTTELLDLLYNQCIDSACCYSFFIYPTGRIRVCKIIRIFHGCKVRIEKSVRGSLFGNTRLCRVIPNSDPRDGFFSPHQTTMIDSFLAYFWSPAFEFNEGVAINKSHSYTLTSAILIVDVVCDVALMSNPNSLTTELRDLLYNQCIDNTCCYSFFIYPTDRIRVCKIRFVSTGENRGKGLSALVKIAKTLVQCARKIECCIRILFFPPTRLPVNSIIHDFSCKILYIVLVVFMEL